MFGDFSFPFHMLFLKDFCLVKGAAKIPKDGLPFVKE